MSGPGSFVARLAGSLLVFVVGNLIVRSIIFGMHHRDYTNMKKKEFFAKVKDFGKKEETAYTRY